MPRKAYFLLIVFSLLLTACTTTTEQVDPEIADLTQPTEHPTQESPDTTTPTLTPVPSVTWPNTPIPTEPLPTVTSPPMENFPGVVDKQVPLGDIFAAGFSDDCPLPCWYGIEFGKSGRDEVEKAFYAAFGVEKTVDFYTEHFVQSPDANDRILSLLVYSIEGYIPIGYWWKSTNGLYLTAAAYLKGEQAHDLYFTWVSSSAESEMEVDFSLSHLMQGLGTPDQIFLNNRVESVGEGVTLIFIYEEGVIFSTRLGSLPIETSEGQVIETCLTQSRPFPIGKLMITSSFSESLDTFTTLEYNVFGQSLTYPNIKPMEEAIGLSVQEFSQSLLADQEVCFSVPYGLEE